MLFDMKIYFLMSIFLLAGGSGSLTAQTVSGKVVDTEQQPVDGATIIYRLPTPFSWMQQFQVPTETLYSTISRKLIGSFFSISYIIH